MANKRSPKRLRPALSQRGLTVILRDAPRVCLKSRVKPESTWLNSRQTVEVTGRIHCLVSTVIGSHFRPRDHIAKKTG
jgi:hypothetical protein